MIPTHGARGQGVDRSQPLFYFVPQEKGLIRRPPGNGKIWELRFFTVKRLRNRRKKPKIYGYIYPSPIWSFQSSILCFSTGDHSKNAKGPQVHLYFFCRHYCISQVLHLASLSITGPCCSLDSSMLARLFEDIWRYKQRLFIAPNIYLAIYLR